MDTGRPNSGGYAHLSDGTNTNTNGFVTTEGRNNTNSDEGGVSPTAPYVQQGHEAPKSPVAIGRKAAALVQSKLKLGPLRTPQTFFGLNEMDAIGIPNSLRQLTERLRYNLVYFGSNYLLLYVILVALNVITHVLCIIALALVTLGWVMLRRITSSSDSEMVTVGNLPPISKKLAFAIMTVFTGTMALLMIGKLFGWSLFVTVTLTLVHASLRNTSELSANQHQLEGDLEFGDIFTSTSPA